ncbi:MAG: S-adenosyl-L-methionine-dependent methyltransferase [Piptocephalis tieghemiana]|nr:MAG: S-adenosyl-L-methionine-dependent methyltransferase [Piptocephalis tieghemiana]
MLYSLEKAASGLCIFLAPRLVPAMLQRYSKDMLHLTFRLICQGSIYNRLGDPSLLTHTGGITSPLHPSRLHIVQVTRSPGTKERYITTLDARVPPSRPGESLGVQPSLGKELREHLYNKGLPVIGNGAFTQTLRASRDKGLFMSLLSISFPHPVELTESQDDPSSSQQPSLINVTYPEPIKFGSLRDREETFYARQHQRDEEELRRGGKLCPAQEGQDPTLAGPIAYLVGTKEFYGLRFHVTRDTLIPRVSTERLVHTTLSLLSSRTSSLPSTILDVGTGTGCILLSILKHSSATGRGVDISAEALEVAVRNAKELGLEDRVTFQRGDLYRLEENHLRSQGQQPYTIIVCNPPYLRPSKTLALVSQSGEPEIALMAGSTGLEAYRGLLSSLTRCPELLAPLEGRVVLEVGQGMHKSVEAIWCGPGKEWEVESRVRDQQQWIRCLVLRRVIAQTTRCNEDGNDHIL